MWSTRSAATPVRRRRADADRSIARIVAAARDQLGRDPGVGLDDIARAAGVGRMTLYGHFPSRGDLVEAVLVEALGAGEAVLSAIDLSGDAREAMRRLLTTSWSLVAESVGLMTAADGVVAAERLRQLHGRPAERISALIERGQGEGAFRVDLPLPWLVSAVHMLVHGAAGEVRAGRLSVQEAPRVLSASVIGLLTPAVPAAGS